MIGALQRVRAAVLAVGLVATSSLLVVIAPSAARASGCGSDDVAVVVNFSHWGGSARVGCVGWSSSLTGLTGLQRAGFGLTGTARYGLAFICRIDGHPAAGAPDHEDCQQTPSDQKYWSYWHANPGQTSWSYSTLGVASYHPHEGSVDAWTFGGGSAPPFSPSAVLPARTAAPTTHRTTTAVPTSAARPTTRPRTTAASRPSQPTPTRPGGKTDPAAGSSSTDSATTTVPTSSRPGSSTPEPTSPATGTTRAATNGSTSAGGSPFTCTSTSTGTSSDSRGCGPTPAIVANTPAGKAAAKASGSPLPTIAGIVIVAALTAGGGGYAWRRRAGTHAN